MVENLDVGDLVADLAEAADRFKHATLAELDTDTSAALATALATGLVELRLQIRFEPLSVTLAAHSKVLSHDAPPPQPLVWWPNGPQPMGDPHG